MQSTETRGEEFEFRSTEDTLPDRRCFILNSEQWEAFQAALNAQRSPAPRLARLLSEPSVFEIGIV